MAKRFSLREFGLLMAPVLVVGAAGWWASKRPKSLVDNGKPRVTFHIEKPTTLEAFEGAQGVFVLGLKQPRELFQISGTSAHLQLQTARGPITLNYGQERQGWGTIWHGNLNNSRFPVNLNHISPGQLSFGTQSLVEHDYQGAGPPTLPGEPFPLRNQWKINRTQLKAPNLAAMSRKPSISLLTFQVVTIQASQPEFSAVMTGEAIFKTDAAKTTNKTPFEVKLVTAQGNEDRPRLVQTKVPNQWKAKWTMFFDESKPIIRFSGRVSAGNRWPLGFEIEPFDSNIDWKVAPKLRFKQGPVALPKP